MEFQCHIHRHMALECFRRKMFEREGVDLFAQKRDVLFRDRKSGRLRMPPEFFEDCLTGAKRVKEMKAFDGTARSPPHAFLHRDHDRRTLVFFHEP